MTLWCLWGDAARVRGGTRNCGGISRGVGRGGITHTKMFLGWALEGEWSSASSQRMEGAKEHSQIKVQSTHGKW